MNFLIRNLHRRSVGAIPKKRVNGFTLLEILLVTLVLVVIAGMTVPNFSPVWKRMLLKRDVQDMAYLIRYAQSRAITQGVAHRINFEQESGRYWLMEERPLDDKDSQDAWERVTGQYGRTRQLGAGVLTESSQDAVDLFSDGTISPLELRVCSGKICYLISTIGQRGRVHVYEWEQN